MDTGIYGNKEYQRLANQNSELKKRVKELEHAFESSRKRDEELERLKMVDSDLAVTRIERDYALAEVMRLQQLLAEASKDCNKLLKSLGDW